VRRIREDDEPSGTKIIAVGDKVKILTKRVGTAYEKGRQKFTKGIVKGILGKVYEVLWDGDAETMKSHITHLDKMIKEATPEMPMTSLSLQERIDEIEMEVRMEDIRKQIEGWFKTTTSLACVLPILEVHAQLRGIANDTSGNWPKDFLQEMTKEDWREWVSAVKKEIESWRLFDAAKEINYENMEKGATIIPQGEFFTRKRCGKYNFRQIAMRNMLKKGRDYGENFSSTISGDGLR
jgi:hypothetical protein